MTATAKNAYRELETRFARINHIRAVEALLYWDSKTMMPPGGAASRADQMATLAQTRQSLLVEGGMQDLLAQAESESESLDAWQRANLREMRRIWRHASAVDEDLAAAVAKHAATASSEWARAKQEERYSIFAPALRETVRLQRQVAEQKAAALGCDPYDALLDAFDPDTSTQEVERTFAALEEFLPALLRQILDRQASVRVRRIEQSIPQRKQEQLIRRMLPHLGYVEPGARLDPTTHPFSLAEVPGDTRITTRYDERNFMSALIAAFHECGHALYEMGLPAAYRYQPVGDARGSSLHESQALGLEMQACRSEQFLGFLFTHLRECFEVRGPAWDDENLLALFRRVSPGLIRVDADEVTYPLHVILRYRMERALLAGALDVNDLPEAWNGAMHELLGIRPDSDARGCLQDIHWAVGLFGYFPTYALGAIKAAQFFAAARRAHPHMLSELAAGNFTSWIEWLRVHVHRWGSFHSARALLRDATGADLDVSVFRRHLEERYLG